MSIDMHFFIFKIYMNEYKCVREMTAGLSLDNLDLIPIKKVYTTSSVPR